MLTVLVLLVASPLAVGLVGALVPLRSREEPPPPAESSELVHVRKETLDGCSYEVATLAVPLAGPLGSFRVIELALAFSADFAARFSIEGRVDALAIRKLARHVPELFAIADVRALEAKGKHLFLEVRLPAPSEELMAHLGTLAAELAPPKLQERPDAKPRCAYCHGDLAPPAVGCEKCQTLVHEACWLDHGRCPTLACAGSARVRDAAA